jgi:ABC-type antimicrobial peptide transport system permease subunit
VRRPANILRLVLARTAALIEAGVAIGAIAGRWAARFVASLLFGVGLRDAATFITGSIILIATGALAAWLPARRATAIDPACVLARCETSQNIPTHSSGLSPPGMS